MPAELHYPLEVVADALAEEIEDEPSVVKKENGEQKNQPNTKAKLAQTSNSHANARDSRNGRQNSDAPYNHNLNIHLERVNKKHIRNQIFSHNEGLQTM